MNFIWTDDDDQSFHAAYMRDQFDRALRKWTERTDRSRTIDADVARTVQPARMIDPIDPRRI